MDLTGGGEEGGKQMYFEGRAARFAAGSEAGVRGARGACRVRA